MRGWYSVPLALWLLSLVQGGSRALATEPAPELPLLQDGQDKVLYLPIPGDAPAVEKIRQKEVAATERFLESRGVLQSAVLTPVTAPEVFLQVEPALMVALQAEACAGKEEAQPAETLALGQSRLLEGDLEGAREFLERVSAELPCAQSTLTRTLMAEYFLWSGLTHRDWPGASSLGLVRTGLSIDPTLVDNPRLPEARRDVVRGVAADLEEPSAARVDLHMPQDEGALWLLKNLVLDGRRLVFEKLFVQLPPGRHYLQVTLPNDRVWGAFVDLEPATRPDLAELGRARFGSLERYKADLQRLLSEGFCAPALADGFRLYAALLKRDRIILSALSLEDDGTWITVRTWSSQTGVGVPPLTRAGLDGLPTASVPLVLFSPWALELQLSASGMRSYSVDYRAPGLGLSIDLSRKLPRELLLGASLGLGVRTYFIAGADQETSPVADLDPDLGLTIGRSIELPRGIQVQPDLGYHIHLNALRGIPLDCTGETTDVSPGTATRFECAAALQESESAYRFNLRGIAHGPRGRVAVSLPPISLGLFFLRAQLKLGYSPLMVGLPAEVAATLYTRSADGPSETTATLSIAEDSRSFLLHQLDMLLGFNGTY